MSDEQGVIQSVSPADTGAQAQGAQAPQISPPEVGGQVVSPEQSQGSTPQPVDPMSTANAAAEGQLKALLAEREKRQLAERQAEFYRQMAEAQVGQQQQQPQKYDPDDLASYSSVEEIVNSKVAQIQKSMRSQQLEAFESAARAKYNDFDSVLALAVELSHENEGLGDIIMNTKNPAEMAYLVGKSHPRYSNLMTQKATQNVAERIAGNLNGAPTLSSVGGGTVMGAGTNWASASKEDVERRIQQIKRG